MKGHGYFLPALLVHSKTFSAKNRKMYKQKLHQLSTFFANGVLFGEHLFLNYLYITWSQWHCSSSYQMLMIIKVCHLRSLSRCEISMKGLLWKIWHKQHIKRSYTTTDYNYNYRLKIVSGHWAVNGQHPAFPIVNRKHRSFFKIRSHYKSAYWKITTMTNTYLMWL